MTISSSIHVEADTTIGVAELDATGIGVRIQDHDSVVQSVTLIGDLDDVWRVLSDAVVALHTVRVRRAAEAKARAEAADTRPTGELARLLAGDAFVPSMGHGCARPPAADWTPAPIDHPDEY